MPGSDLVGRESIIRSLVNRLQRGENLILASPQRTGKTSVAMEVLARLQAGGNMTVYLDFFRYATPEGFTMAFTDEVLKNDRILARGLRWVAQHLPVLSEVKSDFGEPYLWRWNSNKSVNSVLKRSWTWGKRWSDAVNGTS